MRDAEESSQQRTALDELPEAAARAEGPTGPDGGRLAEAGATADGRWLVEAPAGGRRGDLWVLVCGGIAAAAAFAAAFVASGGVSHPAVPAAVPAVVSQACPSATPAP